MPTTIFEAEPGGEETFLEQLWPSQALIRQNVIDDSGNQRDLMIVCYPEDIGTGFFYFDCELSTDGESETFEVSEKIGEIGHGSTASVYFFCEEHGEVELTAEHRYLIADN